MMAPNHSAIQAKPKLSRPMLPSVKSGLTSYSARVEGQQHARLFLATLRRYLMEQITYFHPKHLEYDRLDFDDYANLNINLSLVPFKSTGEIHVEKIGGQLRLSDFTGGVPLVEDLELIDLGDSRINLSAKIVAMKPKTRPQCQNISTCTFRKSKWDGKQGYEFTIESDTQVDFKTQVENAVQSFRNAAIAIIARIKLDGLQNTPAMISNLIAVIEPTIGPYIRKMMLEALSTKNILTHTDFKSLRHVPMASDESSTIDTSELQSLIHWIRQMKFQ